MTVYERTLDRIIGDAVTVPDWHADAGCGGLGTIMGDPDFEGEALELCRSCDVLALCRAWVTSLSGIDDPGGVCGGTTEKERKALRGEDSAADAAEEARRARDAQRQARAEETYTKFVALRRRMTFSSAAVRLGISITLAGRLEDRRVAEIEAAS